MAQYEFGSDFSVAEPSVSGPHTSPRQDGVSQLSDVEDGRTTILGGDLGDSPDYVQEFLVPGFSALDEAMKAYWSGIRVPTKDSYRFMRVKVAGGDKSVLFWNDDLQNGRVRLPVASLNRGSHEFNKDKYSPPYLAMAMYHTSIRRDRIVKVMRPVPFLVEYTLISWSMSKRDADYILWQVLTRFNPIAEFVMYDGHLEGTVQLRFLGSTDTSDKEVGFDQRPKVRYEYKITAEAWLPLPEHIVPTVLGNVTVLKEQVTNELLAILPARNILR